jgi:hypothetical protein
MRRSRKKAGGSSGGDKMDINLTGQFWIIPINLMVSISEPSWWLPLINLVNLLPLLVVVIGAYFTYHYAHRLDNEKNRYDLKVKIYFEVLDLIHSFKMYKETISFLKKKPLSEKRNVRIKDLSGKSKETSLLLFLHIAKLQVVSNSDIINKFFDLLNCVNSNETDFDLRIFAYKQLKLTKAIRKDLGGEELDWNPDFLNINPDLIRSSEDEEQNHREAEDHEYQSNQ